MATLRELVTKLAFKVDRAALKIAAKLMDNVGKSAEEVAKKTEKAERAMKNISNVAKGVGLALTGAFVGAGIAVATAGIGLLKFNDRVKTTIAQIGILGGDMGQATNRFKEILAISQRTGQSFDKIAKLYGKVSMAAKDLGVDNKQVMTGLEVIAQAGVLSGTDAGTRNGALLQLGQAFGSATVQAEEYNSVLDGLPKLHQEIAKSMGMSGAQLSRFIKDTKKTGGITGKQLFKAVLDAAERMNSDFSKMPLTLDRVMNKIEVLKMTLGMDLEKEFKIPDAFLQQLDGAVDRMAAFVRANKDLIGLGIKAVFQGMSLALKATEAAIVGFTNAIRWIVDNRGLVEGALVTITALVGGMGLSYGLATGALRGFLAGMVLATRAIWLNIAALAVHPATRWVVIIGLIGYGLVKLEQHTQVFSKSLAAAGRAILAVIEAGKRMFSFFSNLKLPEIKIPIRWGQIGSPPMGIVPPAGRAPARAAGSGAGSKSFTNTANTTVNINGGGMTPSRARQLGQSFSAGSLNGFRTLEVFGS